MSAPVANEAPADADAAGSWRLVALLLLGTLLVRGGILWLQSENLRQDPDGYRVIAHTLVMLGTYGYPTGDERLAVPTAYRPPLYPLVLGKVGGITSKSIWPVALLHLGLGLATVLITWWLGRQWGLGVWSLLAAGLVAVDPILLQQSTLVMTETLATFLAVVALACLTRYVQSSDFWWAGLCGGALALAMLCRPTFAVWLALVAVPVILTPEYAWRRVANAITFVVVAAIVLAPWVVRNYRELSSPIVATTHGGYTLWLGNNRRFFDPDEYKLYYLEARCIGRTRPHPPFDSTEQELEADRDAAQDAWEDIRENPGAFGSACIYRLSRLWGVLPFPTADHESTSHQLARYVVALWYLLLLPLAAYGLWSLGGKAWQTPWLWGLLLCLAFTLVHTFYWTDLRMRAPLTPMIALAAAYAVLVLCGVGDSPAAGKEPLPTSSV